MAILTLPDMPGLSFPVKRTPAFQSIVHRSVAGSTTAMALQPYALYSYELPYEFLRSDPTFAEWQQITSLFQRCRGRALPFRFDDPDDDSVTGQGLGLGDGTTIDFAFVRTLGLIVDPIQDVTEASITVYLDGVETAGFTVLRTAAFETIYGVRFTVPPAPGVVITGDFDFTYLCQFDDDLLEFGKMTFLNGNGLWETTLKFTTWGQ